MTKQTSHNYTSISRLYLPSPTLFFLYCYHVALSLPLTSPYCYSAHPVGLNPQGSPSLLQALTSLVLWPLGLGPSEGAEPLSSSLSGFLTRPALMGGEVCASSLCSRVFGTSRVLGCHGCMKEQRLSELMKGFGWHQSLD